jgi:hypothetical protein
MVQSFFGQTDAAKILPNYSSDYWFTVDEHCDLYWVKTALVLRTALE